MNLRKMFQNYKAIFPFMKNMTPKRMKNILTYIYETRFNKGFSKTKPIFIDIVPTKRCNLDCIFCIKYNTKGQMDLDLKTFKNVAKQLFPYALFVYFCSGGEPFLNKDMKEFLKICKRYKVGVGLVTNGSFLTKELCEFLIKNTSLYNISVSFDGARKETVESIRKNVNYDKVVESMKTLSKIKKKLGRKEPILTIRCSVMMQNIKELPELVEKAHEWGMDEVRVNYLSVVNKMSAEDSLFKNKKLAEKYFREAKKVASKNKIKLILPPKIENKKRNDPCYMPWRFTMIDTDGTIRFCYKSWGNPVGNIMKEKNFSKIWNNEDYKKVRSSVNTKKPYYRYCEICPYKKGAGFYSAHTNRTKDDKYYYSFDKKSK
jgi:radical SAM protein with 4Fe4S-binding SPASM domain